MSKGKKCIPIVVFLLFIAVGVSKAEPTPSVQLLMNIPVSIFEFGIYTLENRLFEMRESWAIINNKPTVTVQYNYDLNRITIRLIYLITKKDEIKVIQGTEIKPHITKVIKSLKTFGFSLDEQGNPGPGEHSAMELYFHHEGYTLKKMPKNIGKELDKITEIYVMFYGGKKRFKCRSPLIGNKIYWEKPESKP